MMNEPNSTETMTRYLYGRLYGPEVDAFEERLFADPEMCAELDDVENDLVDRYVAGEMNAAEHGEFERFYLISEHRAAKVAAARAMSTSLAGANEEFHAAEETPSFWAAIGAFFSPIRIAAAGSMAALAVLLFAGYLFWNSGSNKPLVANNGPAIDLPLPQPTNTLPVTILETPIPQNASPPATPSPEPSNTRRAAPPAPEKPAVLAFTLVPPIRSGSRPVLDIQAGTGSVRFHLTDVLDPKYTEYRVELRDDAGAAVWDTEVDRASATRQGLLTVAVPGSRLKPGSYEMAVAGTTSDGSVEDINFYNFVVRSGPEK